MRLSRWPFAVALCERTMAKILTSRLMVLPMPSLRDRSKLQYSKPFGSSAPSPFFVAILIPPQEKSTRVPDRGES